jgi:hypothetical protein
MRFFTFQQLIEKRVRDSSGECGLAPEELKYARLLRHDSTARSVWRKSAEYFDHWASFQNPKAGRSPYNNCRLAFHFVPVRLPNGEYGARFIRAHRVGESWVYGGKDATRQPVTVSQEFMLRFHEETAGIGATDLKHLDAFDDLSGKLVVHWSESSHGTRAWSQWWENRPKEIVEYRMEVNETAFPGFAEFSTELEQIEFLPEGWKHSLASVGGVYMLVCPRTGEQYVGSASSSEGGFISRWEQYAADGHGGNKYLKARSKSGIVNYRVFILELATPLMSRSDVLRREYSWMKRLGTKAHGLNHDSSGKPTG